MNEGPTRLGAVIYQRGDDIDALLIAVAEHLTRHELHLGGIVQVRSGPMESCATSLEVMDLMSGKRASIWEDRGACAQGCRLDERGLAAAEPMIRAAIAADVDLVMINRFGHAESRGAGLVPAIIAAIEAGIPVLTAVRAPYIEAWQAFHGGLAADLPADRDAVAAWCRRVSETDTQRAA